MQLWWNIITSVNKICFETSSVWVYFMDKSMQIIRVSVYREINTMSNLILVAPLVTYFYHCVWRYSIIFKQCDVCIYGCVLDTILVCMYNDMFQTHYIM
jgi:hypothetical protein